MRTSRGGRGRPQKSVRDDGAVSLPHQLLLRHPPRIGSCTRCRLSLLRLSHPTPSILSTLSSRPLDLVAASTLISLIIQVLPSTSAYAPPSSTPRHLPTSSKFRQHGATAILVATDAFFFTTCAQATPSNQKIPTTLPPAAPQAFALNKPQPAASLHLPPSPLSPFTQGPPFSISTLSPSHPQTLRAF